jgi:hypothetical protein
MGLATVSLFAVLFAVLSAMIGTSVAAQTASPHRKGPHGLEGWTLVVPVENQGNLPMTLVIARDNKIVRKFPGDVFVWSWIFLNDGRQVAYESGPLHFAMSCVLADIRTGKEQASFDCFAGPLAEDAPAWVKQLKAYR